jgi:hypothetical protein
MKRFSRGLAIGGAVVAAACTAAGAWAFTSSTFRQVAPSTYDPAHTFLVASQWVNGIGCPTSASVSSNGTSATGTYTDTACTTGDAKDTHNQGLLLAKTGPTSNYASGTADLLNVKGMSLKELGYDIRKVAGATSPNGSHCGAGAPRFDIDLQNGKSYFLGCNSPAATTATQGQGFIRLRWGGSSPLMAYNSNTGTLENITGQAVKDIQIVFDEGQDTGPDFFGIAVLDNIDVNGVLVGQGSQAGQHEGDHHGDQNDQGENDDD